jgi:hypothetical protein
MSDIFTSNNGTWSIGIKYVAKYVAKYQDMGIAPIESTESWVKMTAPEKELRKGFYAIMGRNEVGKEKYIGPYYMNIVDCQNDWARLKSMLKDYEKQEK